MTSAVVSVAGLTKVYKDFWFRARVWAVRELDLEVQPGEIYGLLGPNGSGKSTAIKLILGLLNPTRGRITVFGRSPDHVRTKSRIGYLPEESYLYRFLNARETLDYYGTLFQIPRRERRRRTEELLEMVGLKSAARRPVGEYSKGMARRIGLAQALINDPDLLILDEPTSGLDPIGAKLVKEIIQRLGAEHHKTIILSSHLLSDVEEVCSRVTILYGGRMRVTGTMDEVLAKEEMVQLTGPRPSDETLAALRDVLRQREGIEFAESTPRDRLEELFLRIVQEARQQQVETSGAASGGEFAGFLQPEQGAAVLESLTRDEAETTESSGPAKPVIEQVSSEVLSELTQDQQEQDDAADKSDEAVEVDRSVLQDLTGGDEETQR
jgi:ABC-2 type transport system ATP-binding protein